MTSLPPTDEPGRVVFDLLSELSGDSGMAQIFSEEATIKAWLDVEAALARAEAEVGLITVAACEAIVHAAHPDKIDRSRLWDESRNVGYPILPLVRQLDALLPDQYRGTVHIGATTQDIMDSALALQLSRASGYLRGVLIELGNAFAELCVHCLLYTSDAADE